MKQDNSDQKAFWTGPSGTSWISEEARQDALLSSVAEHLLGLADPGPGTRVLDIGCGTGALSVMSAERVGPSGRVLAVDISEPLLERAAARLSAHAHAGTLLGDAATLDWHEGRFDVALSRFGVMFFADPVAAFANIARALRPGGRIVFAAWGPFAVNPFWRLPTEIASARLGTAEGSAVDRPGPMGLATLALARERLEAAGLVDVSVADESIPLRYPGTAADLADLVVAVGPARRIINAQGGSEADQDHICETLAAAFGEITAVAGHGYVELPARINILTARTPVL